MTEPTLPAYRAVAGSLREAVMAGRYRDGRRLPTEAELAAEHAVSRQTVRRAFHDLVAEGIVYRVPGRGTFAVEEPKRYLRQLGSIDDLMNLAADTTMEVIEPLRRRIDIDVAGRLRQESDVVHTVVFRRLHDGVPFVHTVVHLPEHIARLLSDAAEVRAGATSSATIIGLLEPRSSSPIVEAAQSITAVSAAAETAAALGCDEGHAMLRTDRLYSDESGRAVELAVSHFRPEHYTYRVTLRRAGR
ncbi:MULTISPECIES: GntR family transcriptional regulator [Gordonia]|uniref:GntR family transcriptional regulator n=1 Tax=Gordonia TaxID=2053 RepID=UPI003265D017